MNPRVSSEGVTGRNGQSAAGEAAKEGVSPASNASANRLANRQFDAGARDHRSRSRRPSHAWSRWIVERALRKLGSPVISVAALGWSGNLHVGRAADRTDPIS